MEMAIASVHQKVDMVVFQAFSHIPLKPYLARKVVENLDWLLWQKKHAKNINKKHRTHKKDFRH
jgi:hypothetical protein